MKQLTQYFFLETSIRPSTTECGRFGSLCSSACLDGTICWLMKTSLFPSLSQILNRPSNIPEREAEFLARRVWAAASRPRLSRRLGRAAYLFVVFFARIKVNVEGPLSWRSACRVPQFKRWGQRRPTLPSTQRLRASEEKQSVAQQWKVGSSCRSGGFKK